MNLEETKKKETVRISKKDLLALLSENEHMAKQITELQTRMNELVEENRQLKHLSPTIDEENENPFAHTNPPFISPDIYFDGSNGLR